MESGKCRSIETGFTTGRNYIVTQADVRAVPIKKRPDESERPHIMKGEIEKKLLVLSFSIAKVTRFSFADSFHLLIFVELG